MHRRGISRPAGQLVFAATLALGALIPAHAQAYCLTRTCDPMSGQCELDQFGCNLSGEQLFWASSCVSFGVQKDGSQKLQIDSGTLERVMVNAFQRWTGADCGNGALPNIQIVSVGAVSCASPEYNQSQPNANVITFHDSPWTHTNAQETVALTSIHFNVDSGEIYDADVEINSDRYTFADGDPVGTEVDLNAALTHEAGHFLGLSHSGAPEATMYWLYSSSATQLASDDVTAICLAIPPDRSATTDDCTPRHGFSGDCAAADTGCCASAVGRNASGSQIWALLAALFGVCAWRGRQRARRSGRRGEHDSV